LGHTNNDKNLFNDGYKRSADNYGKQFVNKIRNHTSSRNSYATRYKEYWLKESAKRAWAAGYAWAAWGSKTVKTNVSKVATTTSGSGIGKISAKSLKSGKNNHGKSGKA
jgi:hypothetical protein